MCVVYSLRNLVYFLRILCVQSKFEISLLNDIKYKYTTHNRPTLSTHYKLQTWRAPSRSDRRAPRRRTHLQDILPLFMNPWMFHHSCWLRAKHHTTQCPARTRAPSVVNWVTIGGGGISQAFPVASSCSMTRMCAKMRASVPSVGRKATTAKRVHFAHHRC